MYECFTNGTACYLGDYICYLPPSTTELEMKKKFTRSPSIRWYLGCQNGRSHPSSDGFFHLLPLVCNQCWNQNLRLKKCTKTKGTPTSYVFFAPIYIHIYGIKLPGWGHVSIFGNFFFSPSWSPPTPRRLWGSLYRKYFGPTPWGPKVQFFPRNSPKTKKNKSNKKVYPEPIVINRVIVELSKVKYLQCSCHLFMFFAI